MLENHIKSYNGIIEWVGLEGALKITELQSPAMSRAAPHQLRLPRAPSKLALSASRDGTPQLLWQLCQHTTTPLNDSFPPDI